MRRKQNTIYTSCNVCIYSLPSPCIPTFASAPFFALLLLFTSAVAVAIAIAFVLAVALTLVSSGYVPVHGAGEFASLPVVDVRQ